MKAQVSEQCNRCEEREATMVLALRPICQPCARAVAVELIQVAGRPVREAVTA